MTYFHESFRLNTLRFKLRLAIVFAFLLLFGRLPALLQAQEADELFQQKAFRSAAIKYESSNPSDIHALEQLAHSYRLNHDTQNAEKYYAMVVNYSYDPLNYLYYAQSLQSNGKADLAKDYFLKYDKLSAVLGDHRGRQFAEDIEYLPAPVYEGVTVANLEMLNSEQTDYSPVFYQNGIVFASTRATANQEVARDKWTGANYSKLYFSESQEDQSFTAPTEFSTGLTAKFHEGPLTFSKKGDLLLYTRNVSPKKNNTGKEHFLKIATAIKLGKRWLKDDLPDLGWKACNDVHPSLSHDGMMLLFASDRPGGYGGMDLYVSQFSNDRWSTPINLGSAVNTAGNEVFPFIHENGTLYFASDGRGGFGGLDIFFSQATAEGDWETATNLGQPFNSPKDDFGYIINSASTNGYFSSARDGGKGKDDLYHFTMDEPIGRKIEKWKKDKSPTQETATNHGISNKTKESPIEKKSKITTAVAPFLKELESISKTGDFLQLEHIYYDYGQSAIRPDAAQELDLIARFLGDHPTLSIELRSHTDSRGEAYFNKDLSESRARTAASYLMQKDVAAWRIKAIGMGEENPLNKCVDGVDCSEEEHQINRRTEIRFF
ncbi:MAG: OmpA family protein [Bacteroidota bacterium]